MYNKIVSVCMCWGRGERCGWFYVPGASIYSQKATYFVSNLNLEIGDFRLITSIAIKNIEKLFIVKKGGRLNAKPCYFAKSAWLKKELYISRKFTPKQTFTFTYIQQIINLNVGDEHIVQVKKRLFERQSWWLFTKICD